MYTGKKLEIITNSLNLQHVIDILEKVGVFSYNVIKDVTGKDERGEVSDDLETEVLTNVYVMSICTEEQEHELVKAIRPILKRFGGECIVSDVKWTSE